MQRFYPDGFVPLVQAAPVSGTMDPNTRQLVKFENFMEINQKFVEQTAATTTPTVAATGDQIVSTVNVPPHINGFYVAGRTTGHNIDGMNGKTTVKGLHVQILDAAGTKIIGCTEAPLN